MKQTNGIDVSTWNVINDYKTLANEIDFAIIKATQGKSVTGNYSMFTDSKFVGHLNGLHGAGVKCGVYHYLTASNVSEARVEAEYFCNVIQQHKNKIELWAAVDVEEQKYLPLHNKPLLTNIVTTFCQVVESKGFKPMVYTNPNFLINHMNNLKQYDLWLALWRSVNLVPSFDTYPNMKVWQYSDNGRLNGVIGAVDMNVGFFKFDEPSVPVMSKPSDWAVEDWKLAIELGITDGTRPLDTVTREECVVMILRALGKSNSRLK